MSFLLERFTQYLTLFPAPRRNTRWLFRSLKRISILGVLDEDDGDEDDAGCDGERGGEGEELPRLRARRRRNRKGGSLVESLAR